MSAKLNSSETLLIGSWITQGNAVAADDVCRSERTDFFRGSQGLLAELKGKNENIGDCSSYC